jgi:hypothetical protein
MPYFAYVCQSDFSAYAIKVLAENSETARERVVESFKDGPPIVKMIEIGSCENNAEASDKLYDKACKKAYQLSDEMKPQSGCNEKTGRMF